MVRDMKNIVPPASVQSIIDELLLLAGTSGKELYYTLMIEKILNDYIQAASKQQKHIVQLAITKIPAPHS